MPLDELVRLATTERAQLQVEEIALVDKELVQRGVTAVNDGDRRVLDLSDRHPKSFTRGDLIWPPIEDEHSAVRLGRIGAVAAWTVSAVTVVILLRASGTSPLGRPGAQIWSLFEAGLYVGIGIGMWHGSLTSAILGLVAYTAARIYIWSTTGHVPGGLAIVFVWAFVNGIRGTLAIRSFKQAATARQGKSADA
jgi:hypothetical protein